MLLASCVLARAYGGTCRLFLGLDGSCLHGRPDNFTSGKVKNVNMKNNAHKMDRDGNEKSRRKDGKRRGGERGSVCEKQREESSAGLVGTVPI